MMICNREEETVIDLAILGNYFPRVASVYMLDCPTPGDEELVGEYGDVHLYKIERNNGE